MQKFIGTIVCLFFFGLLHANAQSSLKLEVHPQSNNWWVAVSDIDAAAPTSIIELREASGEWVRMNHEYNPYWRFWTYQSTTGLPFTFPLSFRFTSNNGAQVTFTSALVSFNGATQVIDSLLQYDGDVTYVPPTEAPAATGAPATEEPATEEPATETPATEEPATEEPATEEPATEEPATEAPTEAPVDPTEAPTEAPVDPTEAPTEAPVDPTKKPTKRPTKRPTEGPAATSAPTATTANPTAAPFTGSSEGCGAKTKILVPLYMYPAAVWDKVAEGASKVDTVAIINPSSGPTSKPDSTFTTYMNKLDQAGVDMIGYVYTSYGSRSISAVKADIDTYATQFPLLKGIFLDEVSATSDKESFYKELYSYIMSMPGWKYDVINPGSVPTAGYYDASTTIVSLENYGSSGSGSTPSYASCENKDHFSAIVHTVSSGSMGSTIDSLLSKQYFGYLYVTDGAGGCCTYNTLASYYSSMVDYIASKNN
jgi:hypothetical protein